MKAILKNYRQSPRKVRLVADLVRGKKVDSARTELSFLAKRAALPFLKLLDSAVANARANFGRDPETLYVAEVAVDQGVTLKRRRARARGSAFVIRKRSSHIVLTLADAPVSKKKKASAAAPAPKKAAPARKAAAKPKAAPKKKEKTEV